jgi:hypothetical protein
MSSAHLPLAARRGARLGGLARPTAPAFFRVADFLFLRNRNRRVRPLRPGDGRAKGVLVRASLVGPVCGSGISRPKGTIMQFRMFGVLVASGLLTGLTFSLEAAAQSSSAALSSSIPWQHVPNGKYVRADCVHKLPIGAHVDENGNMTLNGTILAHYNACPEPAKSAAQTESASSSSIMAPTTGGWVEDVSQTFSLPSGDYIDQVYGTWVVPALPPGGIGTNTYVFLWNGLQPTGIGAIMQSVLSVGKFCEYSPSNGNFDCTTSNSWQIESWLGTTGDQYYYSPPEIVGQGDTIFGETYATSQSGSTVQWEIFTEDLASTAYTFMTASSTAITWNFVNGGVLEASLNGNCEFLPGGGSVYFAGTYASHQYPNFTNYPVALKATLDAGNGNASSYQGAACSWGQSVAGNRGTLYWAN